jgi:hypothetical protein
MPTLIGSLFPPKKRIAAALSIRSVVNDDGITGIKEIFCYSDNPRIGGIDRGSFRRTKIQTIRESDDCPAGNRRVFGKTVPPRRRHRTGCIGCYPLMMRGSII